MRKSLVLLILCVFVLSGCQVIFQSGRRSDVEKIQTLQNELNELKNAQKLLADRLSQEIKDKQVRLEMMEKGLVITFVAEVLFDSGKEKLREESLPILDKVIGVLKQEVPENSVGIEGHTDNEPIKYSRWKTNWELSAQRALSVLYYLEQNGISSSRLSAIGYGEHHPIKSNDTVEGRQTNRRVEIVILPKSVKSIESEPMPAQEEELK